eukprot:CAMPEP_0173393674 /NCGR_PEP_ID=MMETSP1356-20130122/22249_1 /TAXON_ID=77927 ORGANISM="Hemiselmis virescens, Strain PCC157" /NCGR_SAMPLE_ID=MMETSP1356 /ASSEMBLY_ACC=CAM_ASM_000847 /LENGTH=102 /DNA_ID=CAMNT_0014351731 /DNA_START=26 /DNA_END=331 /DNA_ORIENTATION=+
MGGSRRGSSFDGGSPHPASPLISSPGGGLNQTGSGGNNTPMTPLERSLLRRSSLGFTGVGSFSSQHGNSTPIAATAGGASPGGLSPANGISRMSSAVSSHSG